MPPISCHTMAQLINRTPASRALDQLGPHGCGHSANQLSSKVAVRSGETIVMGGLIQERDVNNDAGIPGLHTAPVVGALFGTTTREKLRTELLVVITPKVVRTEVDVREVTDDLRERMKSFSNIESLQPTKPRTVEPARAFTNQDTAP